MHRKVFLSILGTGRYSECRYVTDIFRSSQTRFAQQATLELIQAGEWSQTDTAIILLTESARKANWKTCEKSDNSDGAIYDGLSEVLQKMKLPFQHKDISIPDGKDEKEMWKIFSTIYNTLLDEDELYIDLTHSFRYLPMLLLVLSNYAKFLKNITVKHLSYGNFEARDKAKNEAPIVDLLSISRLQDWTFAAADYMKNGNVDRIAELSKITLKPILSATKGTDIDAKLMERLVANMQNTVEDFQTCRGINILNSANIGKLKRTLREVQQTLIEPFNPLIERVNQTFASFDENKNINNGFYAALWCCYNGLFQQAATILQENTVSFFCDRHKIEIDNKNERELINKALKISVDSIPEDKWVVKDEDKQTVRALLQDTLIAEKDVAQSFKRLTDLRNDLNHCGMRVSAFSTDSIIKRIKNEISILFDKLKISKPLD